MNNELQHHGILGMHWGVRRYQPYRDGERVKGGKEIGAATKVQQRTSSSLVKASLDRATYKSGQTKRLERKIEKNKKALDMVNNMYDYVDKHYQGKIEKHKKNGNDKQVEKYEKMQKYDRENRKSQIQTIKNDIAKAEAKAKASAEYDRKTQKEWTKVAEGAIIMDYFLSPGSGGGKTYAKAKADGSTTGMAVAKTIFDVWNPVYPFAGDRTLQRTLSRSKYISEHTK